MQTATLQSKQGWVGIVRHLHLAPRAFLPMCEMSEFTLVAGLRVEGDRYMLGREAGYYSHLPEDGASDHAD